MSLPPLRLVNARVLTPEGLADTPVTIAGGLIADGPARELDLSGFLILPGIVDAHGDGFERHLAPRRGAVTDPAHGLRAVEAELAANGITTAMLAQFWSWEGGMRGPDFARAFCAAMAAHDARADLRVQLRLEIGCHADFGAVLDLIDHYRIDHVVLNDHLPHAALAKGQIPPGLTGQALKSGRSPAAHLALIQRLSDGLAAGRAAMPTLVTELIRRGVRVGSHDDETVADRVAWRAMGVPGAEFPLTADVAAAAHAAGDPVVMGAPNVLRGGSHRKGGLNARDVVLAGHCDALASDYHYPAPLGAVRALMAQGWSLDRAWPLVSDGPARMLGMTDRGRIVPGVRADLIIVDPDLQEVQGTIAGGVFTHAGSPVIERLIG
jgi:alpha-D-ribose 1-methylphosphonate 5-triphosphate diphosphatase